MKKFSILFIIVILCITGKAQKVGSDPKLEKTMEKAMTIDKFLALPDGDFWKYSKALMYQNQGFEDGHGMYAWPPSFKSFPKRVGLLSFVVFDPGFFDTKVKKYGGPDISYTVTTYKGAALSIDNTQKLADFFYQESLPELKENFKSFGADLLTPEEFITSDAIRDAYNTFNFEESGGAKLFSGESAANTVAVPQGFKMYYVENFTTPKFVSAIGPKASELGLDAVIIIKVQMGIDSNGTISVMAINYGMYGNNPTPKNPDKKYVAINPATGYNNFVVYDAKKIGGDEKEGLNVVVSAQSKNAMINQFDHIGKLINKLVLGSNYELNMWISGQWKPFKYN